MKINYDGLADSMYIAYQNKKVAFSRENGDGAVFDFDEFGGLVGIELIGVKRLFSKKQIKDSNLMIS